MSLDTRLDRLAPAFTARERAILVLQSMQDRTPEDPAWRSAMPLEQAREFNRLIALINACNIYLPLYITVVEQRVEQLRIRLAWTHSVITLGVQAARLADLIPPSERSKAEDLVDQWPLVELPWDPEVHDLGWISMSERMLEGMRLCVVSHWQELRSVEILLDEVALEFDGLDPLKPFMREVLQKTRENLLGLQATLSETEPLELPEPDEQAQEVARMYFENGRRLMERS